jgi:hypothetical protein
MFKQGKSIRSGWSICNQLTLQYVWQMESSARYVFTSLFHCLRLFSSLYSFFSQVSGNSFFSVYFFNYLLIYLSNISFFLLISSKLSSFPTPQVWVGGASSAAAANDFSLGPKKDPPCTSSPHAFPALVYTTADSSGRPDRVLALSLAHLPPKRPRVLLSENDAGFLCHLHVTKDTNFLQLASASKSCTALWVD